MTKTKSYLGRKQDAYRKRRMKAEPKWDRATVPRGPRPKEYDPMGNVFSLIVRDGPMCHICGLCCDFQKTAKPERLTATQDHIIPISKGGGNVVSNKKLAHAYCNHKRGSGPVTEELRLLCREWILQHLGQYIIADLEEWFNKEVRPLIPRRPKGAIEDYKEEYWLQLAKSEDIFYRCCQGGLCSSR